VNGTASKITEVAANNKAHIVEMVGFMDYRSHSQAVELSKDIRDSLVEGGVYICANIQPNPERILLDWGLLWPMVYRTSDEYFRVMYESGFKDRDIRLINEPFRIHIISVAKKS
jgi:hypothetical protein